ncbi:MAG: MFS transporter [Acidobacteria bacterium]|nr:MAG: MFS transporter [Acidobacteriota bacterium]
MDSTWLSADARLIVAAKTVRTLGYGLLSVALGSYLEETGVPPGMAGLILTTALLGSAALTLLMASRADRFGRKRTLELSTLLMVVSGLVFAAAPGPWGLLAAALTGTVSATSGEVGPFETVEQAMLPQIASDRDRNRLFGWYHTLGAIAVATGALAAALPGWAEHTLQTSPLAGYRLVFVLYAVLGLISLVLISRLSEKVEPVQSSQIRPARGFRLHKSRSIVMRLTALFAVDALGGGFVVQSFLVYWFSLRFGLTSVELGPLFFAVNVLKAVSYPLAVWLANRIGLINTMVFTHLPSNLLLIGIALAPGLRLAIVLLLARHLLAQMDVPARSSYVVAMVDADERTAAAGITSVVRPMAQSISPVIAGLVLQWSGFGLPFFLAGGLKIIYDLSLYASFRSHRAPEERQR